MLKLSDKSKQIRDECLICIDNWIKMQNFEIFAVYLPQLLSTENFEMRNEILNLLSKNEDSIKNEYPKVFFKELTKALITCLQDKNSIIRNNTEELIKELSNFIPREKYVNELKDIKRSISDYLYNILDRILPKEINQDLNLLFYVFLSVINIDACSCRFSLQLSAVEGVPYITIHFSLFTIH